MPLSCRLGKWHDAAWFINFMHDPRAIPPPRLFLAMLPCWYVFKLLSVVTIYTAPHSLMPGAGSRMTMDAVLITMLLNRVARAAC